MVALIFVVFALAAIVVIEAAYWMVVTPARWSPIIIAGTLTVWATHGQGAEPFGALGTGVVGRLVARRLRRPL